MARIGVDYETVQHTALKLLSQGIAPSVQKIREALGTGSNTTLAQHLKVWREQYASQTIHHLPANMPKELISAIEVLWQTAMNQACEQLAAIKHDLTEQQETLRLEKAATEKTENDLRTRFSQAQLSLENKNTQIQTLKTDLAVLQEQLKQHIAEKQTTEIQYQSHLNRVYNEKNSTAENNEKLQAKIRQLKQTISDQTTQYQARLNEERTIQDESERRWVKLIDQARTEASLQGKRSDHTITQQNAKLEKLNALVMDLQQNKTMQKSILAQKETRISELSNQNNILQEKYHHTTATMAVLQERLKHRIKSKSEKPKSNPYKLLKATEKA